MAAPLALLAPLMKVAGSAAGRAALSQGAKQLGKSIVKDKATKFVTGRSGKKGKRGALTKTGGGGKRSGGGRGGRSGGRGGELVSTTPMVGSYRVQKGPEKPTIVGKPGEVSYESINNQLNSIVGLTEVLKKTSQAKLKNTKNRKNAERKAKEREKKRRREELLETTGSVALGLGASAANKMTGGFDILNFLSTIFFGSLLLWIVTNGSKIIAPLKIALAAMNNLGKIFKLALKGLKAGFGLAFKGLNAVFPALGKVTDGIGGLFRGLGRGIGKAFGGLGKGLLNMAKGLINKVKAAGKILLNPLSALTGGERKALSKSKGLTKLVKSAPKGSVGLAGQLSNAARSLRLKHGDEAARMYQGMIDAGMKPGRAAQNVNKALKAGKLTSSPIKGTAQKAGSSLFKRGLGRAGKRGLIRLVGKGGLKFLKRIPIVGSLITLIVSLLSGDPISQALFKTGGSLIGGFLGSFIPIPVIGTLLGEIIGEYVGDLMYVGLMGGGVAALGNKLKNDLQGVLSTGSKVVGWFGDGIGRFFKGLPKVLGVINPVSLMLNPLQVIPIAYKAFFTRDPMVDKDEKKNNQPTTPTTPTAPTTSLPTQPQRRSGPVNMGGTTSQKLMAAAQLAMEVGFTPEQAKIMAAIAGGESTFRADELNDDPATKDLSYGLWQINMFDKLGPARRKKYGLSSNDDLKDPLINARVAKAIFDAQGFEAWGAYKDGNANKYMKEAKALNLSSLTTPPPAPILPPPGGSVQPQTTMIPRQTTGPTLGGLGGNSGSVAYNGQENTPLNVSYSPFSQSDISSQGMKIISGFGNRRNTGTFHRGLDVPSVAGTPVYAYLPGKITQNRTASGYGNLVEWQDSIYGEKHMFAHLQGPSSLKVGQEFPAGTMIAKTGDTGTPGSFHLHWEIGAQGSEKDPSKWVADHPITGQVRAGSQQSPPSPPTLPSPGGGSVTTGTRTVQVSRSSTAGSSSISAVSTELPYEQMTGGQIVMLAPTTDSRGGGSAMTGGAGTPIIMGSGDVVNSYYKSQLLGFLYKQG